MDAQEVLHRYEEFHSCAVTKHWNKVLRESVESPFLKIFQTHLDTALCLVLWVILLKRMTDPLRSL